MEKNKTDNTLSEESLKKISGGQSSVKMDSIKTYYGTCGRCGKKTYLFYHLTEENQDICFECTCSLVSLT